MPGLIPSAEMAQLRRVAESSLDQVATIKRNTSATKSVYGTDNETWTVVYASIPCRIAMPKGALLTVVVQRVGNVPSWILTTANSADVRQGDQVSIGADVMYVNSVISPTSYSTAGRFILTETR